MEKVFKKNQNKDHFSRLNIKPSSLIFSVLIILAITTLYYDQTMRVLRVIFYGEGIERIRCNFKVDGVNTTWGYACWEGRTAKTFSVLGFPYTKQVDEIVRTPLLDHNISGGVLDINGHTFANGIGSHAPSKIAFDLNGKYSRFSCEAGLDKLSGYDYNHGVVFKVITDGKEIYRSPKLRSDADPFPIDCSVAGVKELVLFADNTQCGDVLSSVDWVDLKFESIPLISATPKMSK